MNKNIIAVFGGSFNPPANSHFYLANQILQKMQKVKKIILVPVNVKYNKRGLASNEERFNMLYKVFKDYQNIEISRIEIDSPRQLYTLETLEEIQKDYPENEICFVLGADNLKELRTWNQPDKILKKFRIIVLERGNESIKEIIENDTFLKQYTNSFIVISNISKINLSSTEIRDKVKKGESIEKLVPKVIIEDVLRIYK